MRIRPRCGAGFVGLLSLAILVALASPVRAVDASAASRFVPHRAIYELSLKRASANSDVVQVAGKMAFEWKDTCDGWSVQQRYLMILYGVEGAERSVDSQLSTWEAKDGSSYRFFVKKDYGGEAEQIEGRAIKAADGSVSASFTRPEASEMPLKAGTLFPTEHTFALLDAIGAGKKFFAAPIFDGGEFEAQSEVSAVVGRRTEPKGEKDALIAGPYWPVRLAFFGPDSKVAEPDYELGLDLHDNGIARALALHFKEFAVDIRLTHLEALERPQC